MRSPSLTSNDVLQPLFLRGSMRYRRKERRRRCEPLIPQAIVLRLHACGRREISHDLWNYLRMMERGADTEPIRAVKAAEPGSMMRWRRNDDDSGSTVGKSCGEEREGCCQW